LKKLATIILLVLFFINGFTQSGLSEVNKKRLRLVVGTEIGAYTISMTGLYALWYKNYDQSSFHFFNDNKEWLGMDKAGHFMTSYYLGILGKEALSWANVPEKKAIWYGGSLGWMFLTTIEIFDGFSTGWGASYGDLIANTTGTGLYIGQELLWKEQRIVAKFSYSHSKYAQYNPDLLGGNFQERVLKDYNGQTYWLSVNPASFREGCKLPDWLSLAVGYGADGMVTAFDQNPANSNIPYFNRDYRFYLSPDIDLFRIKTNSKFLNTAFKAFGFIKFPAPTISYSPENGFKGYWLFF
jgi:uncharacterized protein YfiM (DUF2279 family)